MTVIDVDTIFREETLEDDLTFQPLLEMPALVFIDGLELFIAISYQGPPQNLETALLRDEGISLRHLRQEA